MIDKKVFRAALARSRSFRRGIRQKGAVATVTLSKATSLRGADFFFFFRRDDKRIAHATPIADYRKLIRSDVARRERVKTKGGRTSARRARSSRACVDSR